MGAAEPRVPLLTPFNQALEAVLLALSNLCMAMMLGIVCYGVWARYVLHDAPFWGEPLSAATFATMVFSGAAAGVRQGQHISTRMLVERLGVATQGRIEIINGLVITGFGLMMAYAGWQYALLESKTKLPGLPLPVAYLISGLILSGAAIAAFGLEGVFRQAAQLRRGA